MINNSRTAQSNPIPVIDNGSQMKIEKTEENQGCGCPFAGKHERTEEPKEENTIADLLLAISNILKRLLSSERA